MPPFCSVPLDWFNMPSQCWYDWQTLIGGILAIAAALLGAALIHKQIQQVERHEAERRNRRFAAVRATLPLILSGLCEFARGMIEQLSSARSQLTNRPTSFSTNALNAPSVPTEFIAALQEVIEATDDRAIVDLLSEVIGEIQVLSARVDGLCDAQSQGLIGIGSNLDEYIVQAARLHALAESLFEFARRREEAAPDFVPWDRVQSALSRVHVDEHSHPGVIKVLERRRGAWENVWPKRPRDISTQ